MILKDKVVVITGSSSGIGRATAELFAEEGAKLVINSKHNEAGGNEVADILGAKTEAIYVKADVGTPDGAKALLDAAVAKFGRVDILINNAGVGKEGAFLDLTPGDINDILQDNLLSTIYCTQYAVKLMQKQGGMAKILNTSSIRGWEFGGRAPIYGLAKAGVNSLTRSTARMYAPDILVNAVGPGVVKTPNYDSVDPKLIELFMSQAALHRWIDVKEIADAFLFLAKNDAITGEVLYVDAGFRVIK